ncbi:hypothetical protein FQA39_LY14988 [Lamprigera yunnana]|nr:hypothetical protein FQA39_LY14988 [Lamprigera yunnana]
MDDTCAHIEDHVTIYLRPRKPYGFGIEIMATTSALSQKKLEAIVKHLWDESDNKNIFGNCSDEDEAYVEEQDPIDSASHGEIDI